ncbi:usherin isoform X2 [Engystomops pustulosus]|uniref:usherin isoform X2 n=1 Tax=Engystomops pustulosus TaxID=76066 RepID=UPI003AFB333A
MKLSECLTMDFFRLWRRKPEALLHIFEVLLFGLHMVEAQGLFPELENIALYKPIYTDPPNATCGIPKRSVFCQSDVNFQSIQTCTQRLCIQDCPYRAASPGFQQLLTGDLGSCVRQDKVNLRPRSGNYSNSFIFYDHKDCVVTASPLRFGSSFTLAVWLKPEQDGEMCVIEKSADGQIVFRLTISETESAFYYRTVNGLQPPIKVMTRGRFPARQWIHLAVQVHYTKVAFFINGPEEDLTPFDARFLIEPIFEPNIESFLRIGQSINGSDQFMGRMQDFRLYQEAITNREILEVFSEKFLQVPIQSDCRCPGSHPRLHLPDGRSCLPNGVSNTTKDRVLRLNRDAHPVSYMNDNDHQTAWVSSILSTSDFDAGLNITVDLSNGQYQIFYVTIQFYSPMPKALKIQRQKNRNSLWEDWQYFASDCQNFGMENNGFLETPSSVNCLQFPRETPYSDGNVTLSLLTPEPNHRPGYNDFYKNQDLQEFVKASLVRIQFIGQYHTLESNGSFRHRYYGIREIAISGRCNCHGHANSCDTSVSPYKCLCDTESFTDGDKCDRCAPLYNDKPFRQGDHVHAYGCVPCRCHNHSSSCHYDASVDPHPDDHHRGGGGVCDDCSHNTAGRNCDVCKISFYRKFGADPSAADVCQPCDCHQAGTLNNSQNCEELGGQCRCKVNVGGRRCDQCKDGYYNLQESNPDGCQPCHCNTSGTINGSHDCHRNTGQCQCKAHVTGPRCDGCRLGFRGDASGAQRCIQCTCSPYGAINHFCNPSSGQCKCRENVGGADCDTCIDNYYGLDADGCKPCECHTEGIIPGTVCDAVTGQCVCQRNVGGRRCDECSEGYYKSTQNGSTSCLPCRCDGSGAVNASQSCDQSTGQCVCKASVTGRRCSTCSDHTYNLSSENSRGCQDCNCDPKGTVQGSTCDPVHGQCQCLPNYQGRRCAQCKPGFYISSDRSSLGCVPCDCHPRGSTNATCDAMTGQCYCQDSSLTGLKCDQCRETFFGFDSDAGRCQPCSCHPAGAVTTSCHAVTGQCLCKELVSGRSCSHCAEGSSSLDGRNPYGCSSSPSQQPPPRGHVVNSTAIILTWSPPDSPNTNRIDYVLYRDGLGIYESTDFYPYGIQRYIDESLQPYTNYTYHVSARNVHGSVSSTDVTYQTRPGAPTGEIRLSLLYPVGQYSASMNWTFVPDVLGPVETFRLMFTSQGSLESTIAYEGLNTHVTVQNLMPFTKYNFSVHICNSEGCLQSSPITVVTAQAPPAGQTPPVLQDSSSTSLHLQWSPPLQPNGVVIRHELYMRGVHQTLERRVFHASGWLNPQQVVESENENALTPPVTHAAITNLEPNTEYEFCTVTSNMAGSIASEWVIFKTEESDPVYMPPPSVIPLSSDSLNVTWEKPGNNFARGEVTGYTINMVSGDHLEKSDRRASSEVLYVAESHEVYYEVTGLEAYQDYIFTVTLCNKIGCVTSKHSSGRTLASAPQEIKPPQVEGIDSTVMKITWSAPLKLNGPSPLYQLERIEPSLTIQDQTSFIKGVRCPGHGYVRFPPSSLPGNTYFTGIKIQFRTKEAEGLLLCAVSAGTQEEYIVLQISNGRPYFLFDPQDSAVAVTPTNDENRLYNDNSWHQIIVTRNGALGTINVDGKYTGSASATGGGTVIGDNTGVYVGGLPTNFSVRRKDIDLTQIIQKSFVGCLGDIFIQKSDNQKEWQLLDWDKAEERSNVYEKREGCPESAEEGAYFLGFGFLELPSSVFPGGTDIQISFMFKTDQLKGLLLFIYNTDGADYILVELDHGNLTAKYHSNSTMIQVNLWVGLSYCDGRWNHMSFRKEGKHFYLRLNNLLERAVGSAALEMKGNSTVFIGGVPEAVQILFPELQMQQGFGGCLKDISFRQGVVVNIASLSVSAAWVSLDGCPSSDKSLNCRGNDSTIIYRGEEESMEDHSVEPFTEYLYRVIASNEGGSGSSPWSRGRSRASIPTNGKILLDVLHLNGSSMEVTWERPIGIRGIIERYIVRAEPENNPNISTVQAVFQDTSQNSGVLTGLVPFTNYAVTLSVCTLSGCSEDSGVLNITTLQEAPGDVLPPSAEFYPSSLYLHWSPPKNPNGVISQYMLYMDAVQIHTGKETGYNISALAPFTTHRFLLSACTVVGCTNSSQVTLTTAQLSPEYVAPPVLRVLDSTRIHIQWNEPDIVNGILERYMLHLSENMGNVSRWSAIYNSTELFLDYTLQGLTPGTTYFIKLSACSGGGCTESDVSEASTEESVPEGIGPLSIRSHSPRSFYVSWSKPQHPNGVITSYGLYMDGILMQNSSRQSYFVDGLSPWSKHSFRLQACTAKGCALGEKIEAYTQESEPEGNVAVHVNINGPKEVQLKWRGPEKPNGRMTYDVIFNGLFYEKEGDEIRSITNSSRILYRSQERDEWVLVDGLVPFSTYTIKVNASNSQGHVTSAPIVITMPPGAPDGVLPPRLSSANPTSLQVVWSSPVRNNAPGLPHYRLQMRSTNPTNKITDEFSGPSASFTYTIKNLQPYTMYELRTIASNVYGDTYSQWINVTTGQDKPGSIDPPRPTQVKSRSITITWEHPTKANGIITHYNIYQNGSPEVTVPGNRTSHSFHNLTPYTSYLYQLEGCTSAGCSLSKDSPVMETLPDAPSGVLPPDLYSDSPTSVIIRWKLPLHPHGVIESFSIERRLIGTELIDIIATVPGSHPMEYIDQASDINPWKTYEYRMVVSTFNGGTNYSDWVEVTTRPSRPVGVQPPEVTILGPYTAKVTWRPPLRPNGDVISYEIRMPDPRILLTDPALMSYIMTGLIPYSNYSVTLVVCSGGGSYHGGCTESPPTHVTTHSAPPEGVRPLSVIPVSETFIAVSWQPPLRPNGPDIRYELLRRTILQPLTSNPPEDLNLWQNIYSGTQWFCEDKGLSRYTFFEYKLIVYNSVGYTSSPEVVGKTLPGPPIRGSHLTVKAVNHTAIEASWTRPSVGDLQGDVDHYTVVLRSHDDDKSLTFGADVTRAVIGGLLPNTGYHLYVEVSNGPHGISGGWEHVSTLDGEPEGMLPPEVVVMNSTAVRVIWSPPSNPNGVVTEYSIYANDKVYKTDSEAPYVFIVGDLAPYTVYSVQVEVCTVYSCIKSNATQVATKEGSPRKIAPPRIANVTARSVEVRWSPPEEPNGIILGYELRRRHERPCNSRRKLSLEEKGPFCFFIKCKKGEDICGGQCYDPLQQVCCHDVLHGRQDGYECCAQDYIASIDNTSRICCGGQVHVVKPDHRCCGGYYVKLHAGEVCCYNKMENRVSIGDGESCCGDKPYSKAGAQICCGGSLWDGFAQHCCGGRITPPGFICCGDEQEGSMYRQSLGMSCCGQDYVNVSDTTCCSGPNGQFKAHLKLNNGIPLKCCETELITEEEGCCNGIGYNPVTHVCSDKPSTESFITESSCGSASVCPMSMSDTAYCGECHFNSSSDSCLLTRGVFGDGSSEVEDNAICWTEEEIVYSGRSDRYLFTDSGLNPFTTYEYRILTWNSFGYSFGNVSRVTTKQDIPEGLSPPRWTIAKNPKAVIILRWKEPRKLNGVILYVLLRDGVERFKGTEKYFEDQGGIQPYNEYTYQLRACTIAGCSHSAKVTATIKQGIPENVSPPIIVTVNSTALHLSWSAPNKPNGKIREYQIHQVGKGIIYVSSGGKKQYTVSGLQPYTKYLFSLTACTSVGCNSSDVASGYTSQAPPQGIWQDPRHVTINSSALELYWREPEKPNGMISEYRLIRDRAVISTRSGDGLDFTDVGLQPNSSYFYQLEARNEAGSNISNVYVVDTPPETPRKIPVPYNITVLGPYSAFLAWDYPGVYDPSIALDFNVLLNAGRSDAQTQPAGENRFIILEDLVPGARYSLRVQACQQGSCGVGGSAYMVTAEAAPEDLDPPTLFAVGPHAITITWKAPKRPNGFITQYIIYRCLAGGHENKTSFPLSGGVLEYTDISEDLRPHTHYKYSITAQNSAGYLESSWSIVRTGEASPEGLDPPTAEAASAYSVRLTWTPPRRPHGIITQYIIMYQEIPRGSAPETFFGSTITVSGTSYQATVFGLHPFTTYNISIKASNSAGTVSSTWTSIKTWEAAPSGLNFTVEKTENGRALLLRWSHPERTNGALTMFNVYSDGNLEYSGLSQQFLLRRLEPFTVYTLVLEACTAAGCTQTFPHRVQTDEASPVSQRPPQIKALNATHILLSWSPPVQPNGKIIQYDIMKRSGQETSATNRRNMAENLVFKELNTEPMVFTYTDGGLKPWTDYEYKIRAWNSVGYTDSEWTVGQTSQAAPTFILPPKLLYDTQNPNHITIHWTKPEEDNGKILYYKLQKNNITLPFNFDFATLNYTDEDLLPYSEYTYSIEACTVGGCTISDRTHIRTLEGPPDGLKPPGAEALGATEVNVTWSPPSILNGEITKYMVKIDNETYFAGTRLSVVISNLQPFMMYNVSLVACTNGGCASSSNTLVKTKEARPLYMKEPSFLVTSAQSIKISWQGPEKPNGEIKNYTLHRDGQLIYTGLDTHYHDYGLEPGTEYTYTIQASNIQGSCTSSPASIKTQPSSPSGMETPKLQAKSPYEMLVSWRAPLKSNGPIHNYTLHIHHPVEMKDVQYTFNNSLQNDHSYVIKDLKPYTQYEARVEACTPLGCAVSEWMTSHTLEAPPESQPAPLIDVQKNTKAPLLAWNGPHQPNGKIIRYDVYRRRIYDPQEMLTAKLVFNGSSLSFQDVDLLPYTEYEYQVWAVNAAGRTSSSWTRCRTGPAAPEDIPPPTFHKVSSTSAIVNITPPSKPHGEVILYRLFTRSDKGEDTVVSEGTSTQQTIHGLKPFTNYSVGSEACTCRTCCSKGPVSPLMTLPASPSHQRPPHITHKTSRAVSLRWSPPGSPNGIIQRYEIHIQKTCSPEVQNFGASCTDGTIEMKYSGDEETCEVTDLQPFTTYNLRVTSYNSEGSADSDWVKCTTLKEKPLYTSGVHAWSNITTLFLDWGQSFQLNGQLKEFVLTERGHRMYSGLDSSVHIQKTTDKTFYFQVKCTTDMGSVSTPTVRYSSATGLAPEQSNPSTKNGMETKASAIYTELWFILVMALLALLLLAILLSLILQKKLTKNPYPRERPPLVPLQQRMSPGSAYSESDTYTRSVCGSQQPLLTRPVSQVSESPVCSGNNPEKSDLVADVSGSSNRITLKSYIMRLEGMSDIKISGVETHSSHNTMVVRKTSQSQISHSFSQNSLYRSASQLIASHDKKSIVDSSIWDSAIQGHDSGMFMDDEDLTSTIKSFSTVTKQHTAFTDTPL